MKRERAFALLMIALLSSCSGSGQRADEEFEFQVPDPAWETERGPRVSIDAAHHNFHTIDGRYRGFAELLRQDGYRVRSNDVPFSKTSLADTDILVISNALGERNAKFDEWTNPVDPAFNEEEVQAVVDWIQGGGSLLLIADHMPMPAAAAPLAHALGIEFTNSYAVRKEHVSPRPPILFSRSDGTLGIHPITIGRNEQEQIDSVTTFTGQAFRGRAVQPLLVFGPDVVAIYPDVAGELEGLQPRHSAEGWLQGAALELGQGRVAVFGEAAMFSAQVTASGRKMGMNAPNAPENPQFLLNVLHWLSRVI